jgi:hypothetical protein
LNDQIIDGYKNLRRKILSSKFQEQCYNWMLLMDVNLEIVEVPNNDIESCFMLNELKNKLNIEILMCYRKFNIPSYSEIKYYVQNEIDGPNDPDMLWKEMNYFEGKLPLKESTIVKSYKQMLFKIEHVEKIKRDKSGKEKIQKENALKKKSKNEKKNQIYTHH